MAGREAVRKTLQQVRPILSVDNEEARRRVLSLYKAWYRQVPYIGECKFRLLFGCNTVMLYHPSTTAVWESAKVYTATSTPNIMIFIVWNLAIFQCKYVVCNTAKTKLSIFRSSTTIQIIFKWPLLFKFQLDNIQGLSFQILH